MVFRTGFSFLFILTLSIHSAGGRQSSTVQRVEGDLCVVPSNAPPTLPAVLMSGIGKSDFPITARIVEARRFFNQGIAQMHSFWFRESERSFMQVAALDPDAAMAYWGIAMSAAGDYRPAFQLLRNRSRQYQPESSPSAGMTRAREAIKKAMDLRDKVTERERLYIEAVSARRALQGKQGTGEYIRILRKLVAAYPGDLEAKSILALAIQNGYEPVTRKPREGTLESLALLKEILAKDPDHVGAHHYVIHGFEGGMNARDAWHSCKRYAELVPNIPHALHMPGHIYAQTDRLDDAVRAFSMAALSELSYMRADSLYGTGHHAHNMHFLIHSLGLEGRFHEALTRSRELLRIAENPRERESKDGSSAYRQGWFTLMKTLVRFEKWEEVLEEQTFPVYDKPRENAWRRFALGLAHAFRGDLASAEKSLREMENALAALKEISRDVPPQLEIARAELQGVLQFQSGKPEMGKELLRKAAQMELELLYTEPPAYPRPVFEILGRLSLKAGDFETAEWAYRSSLEMEPGSGRALWGLAEALRGLGRKAEADKTRSEFVRAWSSADSDLPELVSTKRPATGQ